MRLFKFVVFSSAIEELEQRIPSTQRALEQAKKDLEKSSTAEQKISQEVRELQPCQPRDSL